MSVVIIVMVMLVLWHVFGKAIRNVPPAHISLWTVLGVRLRGNVGEGWKFVPFPGVFNLLKPEPQKWETVEIEIDDIWSKSEQPPADASSTMGQTDQSRPHRNSRVEDLGLVQFKAFLTIRFRINDYYLVLEVEEGKKGFAGIIRPEAKDLLRGEFLARNPVELLDPATLKAIMAGVEAPIGGIANRHGFGVSKVNLTKVDVVDADVRRIMQLLFRERQERRADITDTETLVLQAKMLLKDQGISEGDLRYPVAFEETINRIREARAQLKAAEQGAPVIPRGAVNINLGGR